jgi:hypothetical protein
MNATAGKSPADTAAPDHDPFGEWLAARGPVPPRERFVAAVVAYVAGWGAGSAVAIGEQIAWDTIGIGDASFFAALVAFFALLGWSASVVPLALYGNHDGWFFRPRLAPFIGAFSGLVILVLEMWLFFDSPPTRLLGGTVEFGDLYLLSIAAVTGSVTWWVYTAWMSRRARRRPEGDAGR